MSKVLHSMLADLHQELQSIRQLLQDQRQPHVSEYYRQLSTAPASAVKQHNRDLLKRKRSQIKGASS